MRNPIIIAITSIVLYPLVKPLGWLFGGLMMLVALLVIGKVLSKS